MASRSKFEEVVNLYREGLVKESIDSDEKINAFLSYSSKHYRLPYSQCVCAFTQKPEATAFAKFEAWNNVFNRTIAKGTRSVGVFDSSEKSGMKYLYDVADTKGYGEPPKHWQLNEEHKAAVLKMLNQNYLKNLGIKYDDFEAGLSRAIEQETLNNEYQIIAREKDKTDILLSIEECATKTIYERLGLEEQSAAVKLHENYSFEKIEDILTLSSEISKGIITDIEREVKHIEKQKLIERSIHNDQENTLQGRGERNDASSDRSAGRSSTDIGDRQVRNTSEELFDGILSAAGEEAGRQIGTEPDTTKSTSGSSSGEARTDQRFEKANSVTEESDIRREDAIQSNDRRSSGGDNPGRNSLSETRIRRTKSEMNYERLEKLAPHIFDGRYAYQSMKAEGFMDLSIERLYMESDSSSDNIMRLSIAHYGLQNGDLMADPEMELKIDMTNKRIRPATFNNDYAGMHQQVYSYDGTQWQPKLDKELTTFLDMWLKNIEQQGHVIYKAKYNEKLYEALETNPTFNGQGQEIGFDIPAAADGELRTKNVYSSNKQLTFLGDENQSTYAEHPIPTENELSDAQWDMMVEFDNLEHALRGFENGFEVRSYNEGSEAPVLKDAEEIKKAFENNDAVGTLLTEDKEELFVELSQQTQNEKKQITVEPKKIQLDNNAYILSDDEYNSFPKEKRVRFLFNIEAIHTLKIAEYEKRELSLDEKKIVAKYSGWGGLSEAFDERNSSWSREYNQLKNSLTEDEYIDARATILNAFYTPPIVTQTIYAALEQLGFEGGKVLEPSMGTGNFIGTMPIDMRTKSSITGVELDKITGQIAAALYPEIDVQIKGFEKTDFKNNQFDVVLGNVPFGDYPIFDAELKKKYLIHDYFFVKSLTKVRPGGIVALVTSSGTMDKLNSSIRSYIDNHADHIGSIRLNEDMFVGTKTTTDIIFLQKRGAEKTKSSSFTELVETTDEIKINKYYAENPEMIIGKMINRIGRFGEETACISVEGMNIQERLKVAIKNLSCDFIENTIDTISEEQSYKEIIQAPEDAPNYSYLILNDKLYYNTDGELEHIDVSETSTRFTRIKDLIDVKEAFIELINLEKRNAPDEQLDTARENLNQAYDTYIENETVRVSKNKNQEVSLISPNVSRDFGLDASFPLISSLNDRNDDGDIIKASIFYERAISPAREIVKAETAAEALIYSINERVSVDITYMQHLTGKSAEELIEELKGEIFLNPQKTDPSDPFKGYETKSEYLSGNVVNKLKIAEIYSKEDKRFLENVEALKEVQPEPIKSGEIELNLGSTWIPIEYYREFMYEKFNTPDSKKNDISIIFNPYNGSYEVTNKYYDNRSNEVTYLYGASYNCNAYRIYEDALNLRKTTVTTKDGDKTVVDNKITMLAREKQIVLNDEFKEWIFSDVKREERLVKLYNDTFNNLVPREYDGSKMQFPNQSPNFNLRPHQKNAVARILQSKSTLLAHEVGAGKTACMAAAGHELKRLSMANKILYVVPNHLVKQMATEIYKIYPASNLLVLDPQKDMSSQKKDISLAKIMTGKYDGIIMSHSSFDRIGISNDLEIKNLVNQLNEIEDIARGMNDDASTNKSYLEKARKRVEATLEELNAKIDKSKLINFEDLKIDAMFVDESHAYKNAPIFTKLNNVAGLPSAASGRALSMMAKMDYMMSMPNTKVIFATGTPVSNSLAELYVNQRYLQPHVLKERGIHSFDRWVSVFAKVVTSPELAVEGGSYRNKERLATFHNVPELITIFKNVADIQTQETLQLPRPELKTGKPIIVSVEPSEFVKEYISELGERAEIIRKGNVDPTIDNFLKITIDGRKVALDARLIDPAQTDPGDQKIDAVVENVFNEWEEHSADKAAQLIFCDQGVPGKDKEFDVYNDIKNKLMEKGIPSKEIQFIHDHDSTKKKEELFFRVRKGDVRVLIGSTDKMGTGTNVQKRLVAMHNVDVPWRPDQEEQRIGRMVRQGNMYEKVSLYRYVTEGSFDAYSWQLIENKNKFVAQIMTAKKSTIRVIENIDSRALEYAEIKSIATGNPLIKDKMQVEADIQRLEILKQQSKNMLSEVRQNVKNAPSKIEMQENIIANIKKDIAEIAAFKIDNDEDFKITVDGKEFSDKKDGSELLQISLATTGGKGKEIGEYRGFKIMAEPTGFMVDNTRYTLNRNHHYEFSIGANPSATLIRINNKINGIEETLSVQEKLLDQLKSNYEIMKEKLASGESFKHQDELDALKFKKREIDAALHIGKDENDFIINENEIDNER